MMLPPPAAPDIPPAPPGPPAAAAAVAVRRRDAESRSVRSGLLESRRSWELDGSQYLPGLEEGSRKVKEKKELRELMK